MIYGGGQQVYGGGYGGGQVIQQPRVIQQPQVIRQQPAQPRVVQQDPRVISAGPRVISSDPRVQQPSVIQAQPQPVQKIKKKSVKSEIKARHKLCKHLFKQYDRDMSGELDRDELAAVLDGMGNPVQSIEEIDRMIDEFDSSDTGRLNVEEFAAFFYEFNDAVQQPAQAYQGDPRSLNLHKGDQGTFIDGEFPPKDESIFTGTQEQDHVQDLAMLGRNVVWARVPDLLPGHAKLFKNIEPNDISQGALGDCWLLAAFACLAEFPGAIYELFDTRKLSPSGCYNIRFYDPQKKQHIKIAVDDYVPCMKNPQTGELSPAFAKPNGNEAWVLILEKAFAKWCGSYAKLTGGLQVFAWGVTRDVGGPQWNYSQRQTGPASWDANCYQKNNMNLVNSHDRLGGLQQVPSGEVASKAQIWELLNEWDDANYIIGASTVKPPAQQVGVGGCGEPIASDGITNGHAYSFIDAVEIFKDGQTQRVVQLRNPWGGMQGVNTEWTGPMSDSWPGWRQYPELKAALEIDPNGPQDGLFWMPFDHFCERFSDIWVCPKSMSTPKKGQKEDDSNVIVDRGGVITGKTDFQYQPQTQYAAAPVYAAPPTASISYAAPTASVQYAAPPVFNPTASAPPLYSTQSLSYSAPTASARYAPTTSMPAPTATYSTPSMFASAPLPAAAARPAMFSSVRF